MEDVHFEHWAEEHIRNIGIGFTEMIAEKLNSIDLPSDRSIITPYTNDDLTKEASIILEFIEPFYNNNDRMVIYPTYLRVSNFWQDGTAYAPFYLIEDQSESIHCSIEKIEVYISDCIEEDGVLFYGVRVVFVPKIEIINPDKIYRLLFRAISRPKAARH